MGDGWWEGGFLACNPTLLPQSFHETCPYPKTYLRYPQRSNLTVLTLTFYPLHTRDASEPGTHHGQTGAGSVCVVSLGDSQGRPCGSHQPKSVARSHTRPQFAHHHHLGRLHATYPVRTAEDQRGWAGRESEGRRGDGTILCVQPPTAHSSAPRYMKYLYPYECETRALSSPGELQAAIDSNRREGRRQAYTAVPLFNLGGPTPRGAPGPASSHGPAPTATPNCPGPTQGSASGLPAHACAQLSPNPVKKGEWGERAEFGVRRL